VKSYGQSMRFGSDLQVVVAQNDFPVSIL
jgi:hypothetical protein